MKPYVFPGNVVPAPSKKLEVYDHRWVSVAQQLKSKQVGYLPKRQENVFRGWLDGYFRKYPRIKRLIKWNGKFTRSWTPFSSSSEEWKELLYYMWAIEEAYKHIGFIKSYQTINTKNPPLDLIENLFRDVSRMNQTEEVFGRQYFLAYLANSLVMEKNNVFSWKLHHYDDFSLQTILDSDYFWDGRNSSRLSPLETAPSHPIDLVKWMFQKKFFDANKGDRSRLDNQERETTRDKVLSWFRDNTEHYSSDIVRKTKDALTNPIPSSEEATWGKPGRPSVLKVIAGHYIDNKKYIHRFFNDSTKKYELKEINVFPPRENAIIPKPGPFPNPTPKPSLPKPSGQFVRSVGGCGAAGAVLKYLFQLLNIPSFTRRGIILPSHGSFFMPAEPDPKNPQMWTLVHGDDLYSTFVKLANPLNPAPFSKVFWKWDTLVRLLSDKRASFRSPPVPSRYFRHTPSINSPFYEIENASPLGSLINLRLLDIRNEQRKYLISNYSNLITAVGGLAKTSILNIKSIHEFKDFLGDQWYGDMPDKSKWLYEALDLYLQKNISSNIQEFLSDPKNINKILSLMQKQTNSRNPKENALRYWKLYQSLLWKKYNPGIFTEQIARTS